jgi:hypothetical protein
MRCYFKKGARITSVEFLTGSDDEARIAEARTLFAEKGTPAGADGFEVWDGKRFVYRFPEDPEGLE